MVPPLLSSAASNQPSFTGELLSTIACMGAEQQEERAYAEGRIKQRTPSAKTGGGTIPRMESCGVAFSSTLMA